jgi:UDP-galactopyranose mutase
MYDYLIIGSGVYGSVTARELTDKGYKCLVIEKRSHIGGNCYTTKLHDINIHVYGAHIFHTSNKEVWDYVNRFVEFNTYRHHVVANYKDEIYSLPFNMWTFNKLWDINTPNEARQIIESQRYKDVPANLEEQALSLVGKDVYEKLIKGYTEKQWMKSSKELPAFIIKRLPVRFTYDNNYFFDVYQGIPKNGYTELFEKLLDGIDIKLNTDYFKDKEYYNTLAKKIIYTGPIDKFYDYEYGELEYRPLKFEHQVLDYDNHQGHSVVNYTDSDIPYTRIIEHKHFNNDISDKTVITKEYPIEWNRN